jgi:hypothetical protein
MALIVADYRSVACRMLFIIPLSDCSLSRTGTGHIPAHIPTQKTKLNLTRVAVSQDSLKGGLGRGCIAAGGHAGRHDVHDSLVTSAAPNVLLSLIPLLLDRSEERRPRVLQLGLCWSTGLLPALFMRLLSAVVACRLRHPDVISVMHVGYSNHVHIIHDDACYIAWFSPSNVHWCAGTRYCVRSAAGYAAAVALECSPIAPPVGY